MMMVSLALLTTLMAPMPEPGDYLYTCSWGSSFYDFDEDWAGDDETVFYSGAPNQTYGPRPRLVEGVGKIISADSSETRLERFIPGPFAFVVNNQGVVYGFGTNDHFEMGQNIVSHSFPTPTAIPGLPPCRAVSAGFGSGLAITQDGDVWGWGTNYLVGAGDTRTPSQIPGLHHIREVKDFGGGGLALRSDGTVWVFGLNSNGIFGDGTLTGRATTPQMIPTLTNVASIESRAGRAFAVMTDGSVKCWGYNGDGNLGLGTSDPSVAVPTTVPGLSNIVKVRANFFGTLAMTADGHLYAWGSALRNTTGLISDTPTPVPVPNVEDVVDLATNQLTTTLLKSDGTIWICGQRYGYDLQPDTKVFSPVQGVEGVTAVYGTTPGMIAIDHRKPFYTTLLPHDYTYSSQQNVVLRITLERPRPRDIRVDLDGNRDLLRFPYSVTVPANVTQVDVPVSVKAPLIGDNVLTQITATSGELPMVAQLKIYGERLSLTWVQPYSNKAGSVIALRADLSFPARRGGVRMAVTTSNDSMVTYDPVLVIHEGKIKRRFELQTKPSATPYDVTITVTSKHCTATRTFHMVP